MQKINIENIHHSINQSSNIYPHNKKRFKKYFIVILLIFLTLPQYINSSQYCQTTGLQLCYPCYYRCRQCNGTLQTDCISCRKQYILFNNKCISCGQNCESCKTLSNSTLSQLTEQLISIQCQTCIEGYYLSQSSGKCIKCATGVQICTLSSVQQCQNKFYEENGICSKCISNCLECSDAVSCKKCIDTYYYDYTSLTCKKCSVSNCQSCVSDPLNQCDNCADGYDGSICTQICQINCAKCHSSMCFICKESFYFNSNSKCQPLKLLCLEGTSFSSCVICNVEYAYLDGDYCVPFGIVHDSNSFAYINAANNQDKFGIFNQTINHKIILNYCPLLNIYFIQSTAYSLLIDQKIQPSFKISIMFQIKVKTLSQIIYFKTNALTQSGNFQLVSSVNLSSYTNNQIQCSQSSLQASYYLNYKFEFKISQNFNSSTDHLKILFQSSLSSTDNSSYKLGISQITIEQFRCLVQNCLICYSSYTCKACVYPFLLENNDCILSCDQGYYYTEKQILPFSSTSLTITNYSLNYLYLCTLQCSDGYFPEREQYKCNKCISPCIECSQEDMCLKCKSDKLSSISSEYQYYLYKSTCLQQCPTFYYKNIQFQACQQCLFPCNDCMDQKKCKSCKIGYLYQSNLINQTLNNKCLMRCPDGLYSDVITLKCQPCNSICKTCEYLPESCTSCPSSYYLYEEQHSCLLKCPEGYTSLSYNKISNNVSSLMNVCSKCKFPCKQCTNSIENCTQCYKGYLYSNKSNNYSINNCLNICPEYYFQSDDLISPICQFCKSPCLSCINADLCQSCISGYKFYKETKYCLLECPTGAFQRSKSLNVKICQKCIPPCLQCQNQTYCISCTGLLFLNHLGQCLLECPSGTYIEYNQTTQQRVCLLCPLECLTCTSFTVCQSCKASFYFYDNKCYQNCPDGTFPNKNGYKVCQLCQYPCLGCKNQYQCSSCVVNFFFQIDTLRCVQYCSGGYLQIPQNLTCVRCSPECETCQTLIDNCLKCAQSYYFNQISQKCVKKCPSGWYPLNLQNICIKCFWPCKTCTSDSTCITCYSQVDQNSTSSNFSQNNIPNIYYNLLYMSNCISQCPVHYFKTNQNLITSNTSQTISTCQKCVLPCEQCGQSSLSCTKCKSPFISYVNVSSSQLSCMTKCPEQWYVKSQCCQKCQEPCKICESTQNGCLECSNPYYLFNRQCNSECPMGYYQATIQKTIFMIVKNVSLCLKCSQECLQCQNSSTTCISCSKNYYLFYNKINSTTIFNSCVSTCAQFYYPSTKTLQCLSCVSPCKQCLSKYFCITCQSGYIYENMKCILNCKQIYYLESTTNQCKVCPDPCFTCKDQYTCTTCDKGYYFFSDNSTCLEKCPSRMYNALTKMGTSLTALTIQVYELGYCFPCSQMCLQCTAYTTCISCNKSTELKYLQKNKCQKKCTGGYFQKMYLPTQNKYQYQCLKCQQNCILCTSYEICQKCITSFLYDNTCVSTCPDYTFASSSFICLNCVHPCQKCYNQASCISCQYGYYLYNNVCVKKCPSKLWTDLQKRQCVQECNMIKYLNTQNKTCLIRCEKLYSPNKQCLTSCDQLKQIQSQEWFINMTLGCQKCELSQDGGCSTLKQKLNYETFSLIENGRLYLILKFYSNMKMDSYYNLNFDKLSQNFVVQSVQKSKIQGQLNILMLDDLKSESVTLEATENTWQLNNISKIYNIQFSKMNYNRTLQQKIQPLLKINKSNSLQIQFAQKRMVNSNSLSIQNVSKISVIKLFYNSLWVQILPNQNQTNVQNTLTSQTFSGQLIFTIQDLLFVQTSSQYKLSSQLTSLPLQSYSSTLQISSFNRSHSLSSQFLDFASITASIIILILIILFFINLLLDNLKVMYYLLDFSQGLFLIIFIGGQNIILGIYPFMKKFNMINFIISQFSFDVSFSSKTIYDKFADIQQLSTQKLLLAPSKHILYGNFAQFSLYYPTLVLFVGIFIIIIVCFKILIYCKSQIHQKYKVNHNIFYNHINNFYWLFINPIWFISVMDYLFNQKLGNKSLIFKILDLGLIIFCALLTLILGFQILKNIFNSSFQQKSFFWGLKRHKVQNQQANIHLLLLMIRKTILLLSISFSISSENFSSQKSSNQLLFYFLLILISLIIISNLLANSPFRKRSYQYLITFSEFLIILFYFGILIYIVNVKKLNQIGYRLSNYALFILSVLVILILAGIAIRETWIVLKKLYKRFTMKEEDAQQQSSQTSKNTAQLNNEKEKEQRSKRLNTSEHKLTMKSNATDRSRLNSRKIDKQRSVTFLPVSLRKLSKKLIGDRQNKKLNTINVLSNNKSKKLETEQLTQGHDKDLSYFDYSINNDGTQQEFVKPAKYLVKLQKQHQDSDNLSDKTNENYIQNQKKSQIQKKQGQRSNKFIDYNDQKYSQIEKYNSKNKMQETQKINQKVKKEIEFSQFEEQN